MVHPFPFTFNTDFKFVFLLILVCLQSTNTLEPTPSSNIQSDDKLDLGQTIPFKCCPFGQSLVKIDEDNDELCLNSTKSNVWTGFFYNKDTLQKLSPLEEKHLRPNYEYKSLSCEIESYMYFSVGAAKSSTKSGKLRVKLLSDGTVLRYCRECPCKKWRPFTQEFCIDGFGNVSNDKTEMYFSGDEDDQMIVACPPKPNTESKYLSHLYTWLFFVSAIFYFILVVIYLLLWETQNLPGWTFIALISSRLFMCLSLGVANVLKLHGMQTGDWLVCTITGIVAHFSTLSAFTWLTVINFDFWWTFRSLTPAYGKSFNTKTLMYYTAFAVGLPAFVVGVGITMDYVFKDTDTEIPIPDYGHGVCHVSVCARGPFIFYIIAGLLALSITLSFFTFRAIFILKKESAKARESSNAKATHDYAMYFKLSLSCGITWVFEFISWALVSDGQKQEWFWTSVDVFNILITAFLIFILFGCKNTTISQLERKYKTFNRITTYFRNCIRIIIDKSSTETPRSQATCSTSLEMGETDTNKSYSTFSSTSENKD